MGKFTAQSSTIRKNSLNKYASNKAADGNLAVYMANDSCSQTKGEEVPWWQVVLDGLYEINRVAITNRGDLCCCKLHNLSIPVICRRLQHQVSSIIMCFIW